MCECVCCAVMRVWKNTENQRKQREMRVVWCVCVVWCCEVTQKTRETLGKFTKHGLLFWHDMAIRGPEKGAKTAIFPNALFLHFPWDLPTIFARGPIPNGQKRHFSPEVLNQRS